MRHLLLCLLLSCVHGNRALAQPANPPGVEEGACRVLNNKKLQQLDQRYRVDRFRIFYTAHGTHALGGGNDRNGNDIPDSVEDLGQQLVMARRLFEEVFHLRSPLQQPRYASAKQIDVFLLPMEKGHGVAYDEPANYRLPVDRMDETCSLRLDLKESLERYNPSPAHELFHLYQYGYTLFKAGWFLEGMARWSEAPFQKNPGAVGGRLPANTSDIHQLFGETYGAARFWGPLARRVDPHGLPMPADLYAARYLDGRPVFLQNRLYGAPFMKAVLEGLDEQDDRVSARLGFQTRFWKESDQRSADHNPHIWAVILSQWKQYHQAEALPALP